MNLLARMLLRAAIAVLPLAVPAWGTAPAAAPETVAAPSAKPIAGLWQGELKAGAVTLRVLFRIVADERGGLKATLDSPDQGAKGIPFDSATREGDNVKLEAKRLQASFEGQLSADGRALEGAWKQAGQSMPLELARLDKEPDNNTRPQEPKKPYPYEAEEVTYENPAAKVKLAGTLTLPRSRRPVPAVLLVTGSGAQDRDETVMGHKPFLVLADYLTRRGVAVLRVDDRGVGGSTGDPTTSTTNDLTGDALAGVAYLKSRKEIDPGKIGLIGHSEGGIIAPLAASRSKNVAFIVLLAGTGVNGEQIILRQAELILTAQKAGPVAVAAARATNERVFAIVKQEPDAEKARQQIRDVLVEAAAAAATTPEAKKEVEAISDAQARSLVAPWFRFFLTYDPTKALQTVRCPVLVLAGEHDLQVEPGQNLPPIEAALKAGGNRDFTIRQLPGLNHLFQHSTTGSPAEYRKIEETFAPEALTIIGDWIAERAKDAAR